jgi:diguanylate cyclase (GGDEF)-like protein
MPFGSPSRRRNIAMLAAALIGVVGATLSLAKFTTSSLLEQDAVSTGQAWAGYLAKNIPDLTQIANGAYPSAASMKFFEQSQRVGSVFRYKIFHPDGRLRLVSDELTAVGTDKMNLGAHNTTAASVIAAGRPFADVKEGTTPNRPAYFAEAYVPVFANGRPIAIVEAYTDQTEKRARFERAFAVTGGAFSLLTALVFCIPAVAWYRRTRERDRTERLNQFLAGHDPMTGLLNRARLVETLDEAITNIPVAGSMLAVHLVDFNRFNEINDTLGHDAGDLLLTTTAARLRALAGSDDMVARLGGDEFAVVQMLQYDEQARDFADRLRAALTEPLRFQDQEIVPAISIGVALAPKDGDSSKRLLKSADLALYRSKRDGRNAIRFFEPEMTAALRNRIELEKTLRKALADNRFVLHFQPLFEMPSRRLAGYEALVRLQAEDGTMVPPLVFIPMAEELQLIGKIGEFVLHEACRTAATWPDHLTIAVNLSPTQFEDGGISNTVADALARSGLAPHRLEVEITESLLLADSEPVMRQLRALKALGVAIVMDDFGTGYSSLSYLWRFAFDKIKIDRSFMLGLDGSGRDAATVINTIIALGRELGIRVTVEGIETARQLEFLERTGADQVQGFFFGRPVPATDIAAEIVADFLRSKQPSIVAPRPKLAPPRLVG